MSQDDKQRLAVFEQYGSEFDANVAAGVLRANGIDAQVVIDSTATALLLSPVRVFVFERDLERAREIMASEADPTQPEDGQQEKG